MFVSPVKEQTDSPKNRNTLVDAIYDFNLDAGSTPAISTRLNLRNIPHFVYLIKTAL